MQESVQTEAYTEYLIYVDVYLNIYVCEWKSLTRILEWVALPLPRRPTQRLNPGLLHCGWILYQLSHQGSPYICIYRCIYHWIFTNRTCLWTLKSFVPIYCHYFYQTETRIKFCHLGCLCQEIPEAPLMCLLTTFFLRVITF